MTTADETAALRAAIREAHEAIQDLRLAMREAREVAVELDRAAHDALDNGIREEVQAGLASLGDAIDRAIDEATAKVFERFDTVRDVLLGEDKRSRRRGEPSLVDLAHAMRDTPDRT